MGKKQLTTICWRCANADTNGCSWAEKQTPVEGWEAIRRDILNGKRGQYAVGYIVLDCPLFRRNKKRKRLSDGHKTY